MKSVKAAEPVGKKHSSGSLTLLQGVVQGALTEPLRAFEAGQTFRVGGISIHAGGQVKYLLAVLNHPDGPEGFGCAWYESTYFEITNGNVSDWVFKNVPNSNSNFVFLPSIFASFDALNSVHGVPYDSLSESFKKLFCLQD